MRLSPTKAIATPGNQTVDVALSFALPSIAMAPRHYVKNSAFD
jgi:hypothetical protein